MVFKKVTAAATAALMLMSTTAVAQASSAKSLSLANTSAARVATPAKKDSKLIGTTAWILAAIGLGLVVWGVVELTGDDSP